MSVTYNQAKLAKINLKIDARETAAKMKSTLILFVLAMSIERILAVDVTLPNSPRGSVVYLNQGNASQELKALTEKAYTVEMFSPTK